MCIVKVTFPIFMNFNKSLAYIESNPNLLYEYLDVDKFLFKKIIENNGFICDGDNASDIIDLDFDTVLLTMYKQKLLERIRKDKLNYIIAL